MPGRFLPPVSILDVARLVGEGTGSGVAPEVTGGYRLGDVRHVVASPDRARDRLGFTAQITFEEGMREFAHAPLRPPAQASVRPSATRNA